MSKENRYLRRRKLRQRRAAAQHLQPIRGETGRRLRARGLRSRRVVGVGQFARGLTRPDAKPSSRTVRWLLAVLPAVILMVWVVARLTRHL